MEEEEEMMKKYHRQKLADHEAHDVFCESTGPVQVCDTDWWWCDSGETEVFSHRSAQVTKRSDKLTTLTTNTGQARQDWLTSGEDLVQQEVGFI